MQDQPDHSDSENESTDWDALDALIDSALRNVIAPETALVQARARLVAEAQMPTLELAPVSTTPEVEPRRTRGGPRRNFIRRHWLSLTAAVAIAAVALSFLQSRPMSVAQLIAFCKTQAESISDSPPQWLEASKREAATQLAPLLVHSTGKLTLIGSSPFAPGGLAQSCRVWKFITADGRSLYVFDFRDPRRFGNITDRLQELNQSSGKWSLAGLQRDSQLLVVVVEGNVNRFFRSRVV